MIHSLLFHEKDSFVTYKTILISQHSNVDDNEIYIWWGLYKTFLNVAVHVLELMEPARTTKELFIVLLLLEKSFNIIVYLIKVISLRIAQNTKFRKFWDGPWIRKRIIFSIQVSLFSVRWRTFLSPWRTQ